MYLVYSLDRWESNTIPPAGSYETLDKAIKHADQVTYKMVVINSKEEWRGFVYVNWATTPTITAIERKCRYGDCTLIATYSDGAKSNLFSYYIDELEFSDAELIGLTEDEARKLRHNRDVAYLRS